MNIELNNVMKSECAVANEAQMRRVAEICSALFSGSDISKYGKEADSVIKQLAKLGEGAMNGDSRAKAEINTVVKYIVQPNLLKAMEVFSFLGNYHRIGYDEQPVVKTYNYEGIDARLQANSGDVPFGERVWKEYPITTKTISSGMAINYRDLASGNFSGNMAEEISQVQIDMENKAVAYVLGVLYDGIKNNTDGVKFYATYSGAPTQTAVDSMINKMRKLGKVNVAGDFSTLSVVSDWNGYKTVGENAIPFYTESQVAEMAQTGLNGFYKGAALVEIPNPYNLTKPLADNSAFETYYDTDKMFFTIAGATSPFNIFRRGGISTMTGNDVKTGTVMTRFDIEIGADLTKGREYEIGLLEKA